MDRLHMMSTFVAVVDSGGLSAAARNLKMSTSAVTRAISQLEELVGAQLLIRTTRVVKVTDAGARYAGDARRILREIALLNESASGAHRAPHGHLLVTAPALFGRMRVMPVVTEYLRTYPDVTASCLFVDRVVNMVDEEVDVAIRVGHLPDSALYARKVGEVRQVVCASPVYLARHGRPMRPGDLVEHCVIARSPASAATAWRFPGDGGAGLRLTPRLTTTTNDSAIEAAVAGFGVVRALSYQVEPLVASGVLEVVLRSFEPAPLPVHLLHSEGRRMSRKVRAFIELASLRLCAEGLSAAPDETVRLAAPQPYSSIGATLGAALEPASRSASAMRTTVADAARRPHATT